MTCFAAAAGSTLQGSILWLFDEGGPMKTDQVLSLTTTFEGHAQQTEEGVEYWLARDLQNLLGYAKWDNFLNAISKARPKISAM